MPATRSQRSFAHQRITVEAPLVLGLLLQPAQDPLVLARVTRHHHDVRRRRSRLLWGGLDGVWAVVARRYVSRYCASPPPCCPGPHCPVAFAWLQTYRREFSRYEAPLQREFGRDMASPRGGLSDCPHVARRRPAGPLCSIARVLVCPLGIWVYRNSKSRITLGSPLAELSLGHRPVHPPPAAAQRSVERVVPPSFASRPAAVL